MAEVEHGASPVATGLSSASPIEPVPVSPVPASIPSAQGNAMMTDGYAWVINRLCADVYAGNVEAGWYSDIHTGERVERNVGELLMLIVSEVAEGMEGHRKSLMDDKLPHRPMLEVELADAVIRIFDLAGYKGFDLGGAIKEKRAFNATRADHKLEARRAGGKAF